MRAAQGQSCRTPQRIEDLTPAEAERIAPFVEGARRHGLIAVSVTMQPEPGTPAWKRRQRQHKAQAYKRAEARKRRLARTGREWWHGREAWRDNSRGGDRRRWLATLPPSAASDN